MALPTRVNRGATTDPFDAIQREFDSMLGRWVAGRDADGSRLAPYGVDIREDADHFYVDAELPGFRKEDVDVTLENQMLTITAERKQQHEDKGKTNLLLNERRYTRFQRSFSLPPIVDESSCDAKLSDGVLRITLNKREESKPRKIQVG